MYRFKKWLGPTQIPDYSTDWAIGPKNVAPVQYHALDRWARLNPKDHFYRGLLGLESRQFLHDPISHFGIWVSGFGSARADLVAHSLGTNTISVYWTRYLQPNGLQV